MDLFASNFYNPPILQSTPENQKYWKSLTTDRPLNSTYSGNNGFLFCVGTITGSDASNLSAQIQVSRGYKNNNVIFDNYGNLFVGSPLIQFTNPIINKPIPVVLGALSLTFNLSSYDVNVAEPLPISFDATDKFSTIYNYVSNPAWITSPSKRWILAQDVDALTKGIFVYNILYNPLHNAGFNNFYQSQASSIGVNGGNGTVDTYIKKYCEMTAQKGSANGQRNYGDTTCNCIASLDDCINQNIGAPVDYSTTAGQAIKSAVGYSCICPTVSSCANINPNNQDTFVRSWTQNVTRQLPNSSQDPSSKSWRCPSNPISFCMSTIQAGNTVNLNGAQIAQKCGVNTGSSDEPTPTPTPTPSTPTIAPVVPTPTPTIAPIPTIQPTPTIAPIPTLPPSIIPSGLPMELTTNQLYIGYGVGVLILIIMIILYIRNKNN